jgi:hypothetical protein
MAGKAIWRWRLVLILVAAISAAAGTSRGQTLEYEGIQLVGWSGSGVNSAVLVVDFSPGNGVADSFAFGVKFGTTPSDTISGMDLMQAVYNGNPTFDYAATQYSFGAYVTEIAYTNPNTNTNYLSPPIPNPTGIWWTYWTSGDFGRTWTSPDYGASDRVIQNGDVDGWLAQATGNDYNPSDWIQPVAPRLLDGDANGDGTVNGADLNTVLSNFNKTFSGDAWAEGDFNGDGTVNGADLNTVLSHFNQSASVGAAVPEPSTFALLAVGALAALAWRRRRIADF